MNKIEKYVFKQISLRKLKMPHFLVNYLLDLQTVFGTELKVIKFSMEKKYN